jgi:hypothetical protein
MLAIKERINHTVREIESGMKNYEEVLIENLNDLNKAVEAGDKSNLVVVLSSMKPF